MRLNVWAYVTNKGTIGITRFRT